MKRTLVDTAKQTVINVIELEDDAIFTPPEGLKLGPLGEGDIGDVLSGHQYVKPVITLEVTPDMVKAEAARRIITLAPEWKQRNLTVQTAELAIKGAENWTSEDKADHAAAQRIWEKIRSIRTASDALESNEPIPADFTGDRYWPS